MTVQMISMAEIEKEAECLRYLLDAGEGGETDMLYAAYQALLMVLGYGVMPPSQAFGNKQQTPGA